MMVVDGLDAKSYQSQIISNLQADLIVTALQYENIIQHQHGATAIKQTMF